MHAQRIIASAAFNNLVVIAILVAGSLVGIMTYPEFADNSGVALLDLLVQIIFQIDVALKIFAEGVNPLNYWVGPQMSWCVRSYSERAQQQLMFSFLGIISTAGW